MGFKQFLACCFIGVLNLSFALPAYSSQDNDLYLKAHSYLSKRQYSKYHKTVEKLQNHPLLPYLESRWIRRHFYKTPIEQLDRFLKKYEDQPPATVLKRQWVKYLAKKKKWQLYLDYFEPTQNLSLRCHQVTALTSTNQHFEALLKGQELWLMGVPLPKACDSVFKNWKRQGYLSQDLVWQRFLKALENKKYKLARYLKKQLPKAMRSKSYTVQKFWRRPYRMFDDPKALNLDQDVRAMILTKAMKYVPNEWMDNQQHPVFKGLDRSQRDTLRDTAIHSVAVKGWGNAFDWYELAKKEKVLDSHLEEAFLLGAVKSQNWPLYSHFYKMASTNLRNDAKWQYWKARALESVGAPEEQSFKFYELASDSRDFYGFMACQHLGISAQMNHDPTYAPASILQRTRMFDPVKRALAFFELNQIPQARREWQYAVEQLDEEGRQALALLAGRIDWPDRAILTLARLRDWHDLQLRFPLAHQDKFEKAAKRTRIDKNWIYGVARQESAFMYDAKSPVGATGLMQLMPSTAKRVSRGLRLRYSKKKLLDPNYNIRLGSQYLKTLLKRYEGNRVLATAAYNAGPGNVNKWVKRFDGPLDVWIESIPFAETKEYVQKVLAYSTIYSYRLGRLQPILDDTTLTAWDNEGGIPLKISQSNNRQNNKG